MKTLFLISSFLVLLPGLSASCQTHKYDLDDGNVTATQLDGEKYLLKIDTRDGAQMLQFQYNGRENGMYIYDLVKIDDEELSPFQKSISYLKSKRKLADLCRGTPDRLWLSILGENEIVTLGNASFD